MIRNVSREQREPLNVKLETYMKKLVSENTSGPIVATTILQEFTCFHINQVLNHCDKLKTLKDVHTVVEVWRKEHATAILNAVNEDLQMFQLVNWNVLTVMKMKLTLILLIRNGPVYAMILNSVKHYLRVI